MARYAVAALTGAGSTVLPIISLYASASTRPRIRELALFNTGAAAVQLKLARLTTAGTTGTALTEMPLVPEDPPALAAAFNTHSAGPTITAGDLYRLYLPAGGGTILTFPDQGLVIPMLANNGIGVVVSTGTGQICEATLIWDE